MLSSAMILAIAIVIIALIFDFINGFHDTANAIATSVSTRVLTPTQAILLASCMNFAGALISTKVAKTIGSGIVDPKMVTQQVVLAALLGAIVWNLITWWFGIPSSSSHALIGGLLGAAITYKGEFSIINWSEFFDKVLKWLFISPVLGFTIGFVFMIALQWILKPFRPAQVTKVFSKLQMFSAGLIAFSHGSNDAQKSMGIIAMALVSGGLLPAFDIPMWVKLSCGTAIALGTSIGGWKIIKTMGSKMARLAPINGFAADTTAAGVILVATAMHAPVSTTHVMSTAIMGVAASKRFSNVRWIVAKNIVWTWVITIPVSAMFSAVIMMIIKFL